MRNDFQANPAIFKIIILITCFMLVMIYNKSKAETYYHCFSTFKKVAVVFTQNIAKKELKVLVKADMSKAVQLYFFSADGKLVKELSVNSCQETVVRDMKRGTYLYECFDNDLKLNSGKLQLQ